MPPPRTVALAGLATFVGIVAVEHLLRPDLSPAERFVSEYALGWTQPLQVFAFLGWAASMLACARLAWDARPAGRPVSRGLCLLALGAATVGAVMAAAFTTQTVGGVLPAGVERTLAGRLHDYGTLFVFAGLFAAALASLRIVRSARYRWSVAGLAVVFFATVPALVALGIDAPGIGQRAFIAVGCGWLWSFAAHVRLDPVRAPARA